MNDEKWIRQKIKSCQKAGFYLLVPAVGLEPDMNVKKVSLRLDVYKIVSDFVSDTALKSLKYCWRTSSTLVFFFAII